MSQYRVHPLPNGRCVIAGHHAFLGGDPARRCDYRLYFWLILGAERPILVDTGLDEVEEMNRGAAHVLAEPITQPPEESARAQLERFGIREEDVGAVIITHLHFDHVDRLDRYPRARIHVSGRGLAAATADAEWRGSWAPGKTLEMLTRSARDRTVVEDGVEVAPGIRTFWVGGHTPCSQAVLVDTAEGRVCLTGDTVSLLENLERDVPIGIHTSAEECRTAMRRIREEADVVLPSHDPLVLERYPRGIGG